MVCRKMSQRLEGVLRQRASWWYLGTWTDRRSMCRDLHSFCLTVDVFQNFKSRSWRRTCGKGLLGPCLHFVSQLHGPTEICQTSLLLPLTREHAPPRVGVRLRALSEEGASRRLNPGSPSAVGVSELRTFSQTVPLPLIQPLKHISSWRGD